MISLPCLQSVMRAVSRRGKGESAADRPSDAGNSSLARLRLLPRACAREKIIETWKHDTALRARIEANLAGYRRRTHDDPELRGAAVSIVVAANDAGEACVLLTRRPTRMSSHAGQYALPGGKIDPGETSEEAARRELHEELSLDAPPAQALGTLDDLPTRSGYLITPFVVWLPQGARITPAPDEIAALFHIPLGALFAGRGRGKNRDLSAEEMGGDQVFSLFIPPLGHDVFAPTAAILDHFREVALMARGTPIVRFGEPNFARQ